MEQQQQSNSTQHYHNSQKSFDPLLKDNDDILILPYDSDKVAALPRDVLPDYSEPAIYVKQPPGTGHTISSNFGLGRFPVRREVTDQIKEQVFDDFFEAQHQLLAHTPRMQARLCYLQEMEKSISYIKRENNEIVEENEDIKNQKQVLDRLTEEYEALFIKGKYHVLQNSAQDLQHPCYESLKQYDTAIEWGFFKSMMIISSTTCLKEYSKFLSCPYEKLPFKSLICNRRWQKYVSCCKKVHNTDYYVGTLPDLESELRVI